MLATRVELLATGPPASGHSRCLLDWTWTWTGSGGTRRATVVAVMARMACMACMWHARHGMAGQGGRAVVR